MTAVSSKRILLTGATGYVGGRLLKALEQAGHRVRCLARRPEFLRSKVAAGTEVVAADLLDRTSLMPAMAGMQVAYYLVHSMGSQGVFEAQDRQAARQFSEAVAGAILDRLLHHGLVLNLRGESYRLRDKRRAGMLPSARLLQSQDQRRDGENSTGINGEN